MCSLLNSDVLIKDEFIVSSESKMFEVVELLYCLVVDGGGVQSSAGVFDVLMVSSFVQSAFSWRNSLVHHCVK